MITKQQGIEELLDSAKRHGIHFQFDNFKNVYVYHATSDRAANAIKDTSHFIDGFFFHSKDAFEGDGGNYAEIRSKQNNETGGGTILEFLVDPRCLLINGAGETESDGDLYLDTDDVWKTKEYLNENLPEFHSLSEDNFLSRINDRLYYKNDNVIWWIWRTFNHYINEEKLNIDSAIKKMISDFEYYEDASSEYHINKDDIDEILNIDEWIQDKLDSGEYDSEEEVRDLEEGIIKGFDYKETIDNFRIDRKTFDEILGELLDDDIFNASLFIDNLKENKLVYIKTFENFYKN